ncbi:Beta-mannosidase B [Fonsecaea pedrosoi]|nr:Beta-mannosidase B [Fonsecaea pedrosoi]
MATVITELHSGWQCRQSDDTSKNAWLPVSKVPTTTHLVLQENGKIPDPFIDMNELAVRWVAEKSWTYKTSFSTPTDRQHDARTDLVFEGLDTFATVSLNGHKILEADNMFIGYRVDVTPFLLQPSSEDDPTDPNVLEIVFESALLRGRELVKQHSHEHDFIAHQTESSRLPVRKAQCHWGWDWGPILITSGPWKRVSLETYLVRIDDVWFQGEVSEDLKVVNGKLFASVGSGKGNMGEDSIVKLSVSRDKAVYEVDAHVNKDGIATAEFRLEDPALWYPRGYGSQCLYELRAKISTQEGGLVSKSRSIGFRRCQLIQEPDEFGKSFYFRINNVDVFAGGSCWIPTDCFLPRIGADGYKKWMELMIEGNQIMTRIWGGGIYEDDSFYEACDTLGILVWQDFCFACASYPTYPSFLGQVEEEARFNVRRLRLHPSLAIWAGNNEDYQVQEKHNLEYDYDGDKDPQSWLKTSFPARYIYEYLLPKIVQEESPGAVYHPSSPWGDGKKTWDPTVGDIHQWNVWHGSMRRYQEIPSMGGRFVSEFGMEAYPHMSTIVSAIATHPQQQYPGSMTMDYHNRAIDHERRLLTYVAENFRINYDLGAFTHLTQVMQSDAVGFAYRSWRREWGVSSSSNAKKLRKCGGVLVWQFNDTWPTMSWAVVDYFRVKKPAFYAIKRSLTPLAVGVSRPFHEWTSGHVDPTRAATNGTCDVWVCSSRSEDVTVDVVVRAISIKTGRDVVEPIVKRGVVVKAKSTTEILQGRNLSGDTAGPGDSTRLTTTTEGSSSPSSPPFDTNTWDPYIIHASLLVDNRVVSTDTAWPHPIKYLDFTTTPRDVVVSITTSPSSRNTSTSESANTTKTVATVTITITASRPVHGFVFRESRDGPTFSDNGFDLVPGEEVVVEVFSAGAEPLKEEALRWTYVGAESACLGLGLGSQNGK